MDFYLYSILSVAVMIMALSVGIFVYLAFRLRNGARRRQAHLEHLLKIHTSQAYSQIEALIGIYRELDFHKGLPPLRGWAASPDMLATIVRCMGQISTENYLECGSGASTLIAAQVMRLKSSGHVFSLEHDPQFAVATRANLRRFELDKWATVIDAPIIQQEVCGVSYKWYDINKIPPVPFDIVFIDGPPSHLSTRMRYPAGPVLIPRLTPRGFILVDDADRLDETFMVQQWITENPGLGKRYLQTEKGCVLLYWKSHNNLGNSLGLDDIPGN